MNTLEPYIIDTPFGEIDKCSKFVIDDVLTPFTLHDVMEYGQQYTLGLWIKTDGEDVSEGGDTDVEEEVQDDEETTNMSILVRGAEMSVGGKWARYTHTFSAFNPDLKIYFNDVGTYYIYRPQLERGIIATDWSESPLDTEKKIADAQDAADKANKGVEEIAIYIDKTIKQIVAGINSGTLLEQTEDGWTMVMGSGIKKDLENVQEMLNDLSRTSNKKITQLQTDLGKVSSMTSYIDFGDIDIKDDSGNVVGKKPFIELGTADPNTNTLGEFRLRITDTAIEFMQYENAIAWISNQELHIEKAVIEEELAVGGFVLKQHGSRNNVGFLWKGVTS